MGSGIFPLTLLCLALVSGVGCLTVSIPVAKYEAARGDNITLPCSFQSKIPKPTLVIITWIALGKAEDDDDIVILTHYSPPGTTDITSDYEGRAALDVDIATGKANLKLFSISLADNRKFECRLQIPGDDKGKPAATTVLVVLVAPSPPICKVQGRPEYGQNINLTCVSEEGSPPPTYKWESRDVNNMPRMPAPRTTDQGGILSLYNISKDTSGYYICTSTNKIRSASCNLTLAVMPPSMLGSVGQTAGIIAAAVGGLILLIIVIYCCCCKKKKKEDEEYAMGVREEEYHDKEPVKNGELHAARPDDDGGSERGTKDRQDQDDRRRDYDDRRSDYDDRRSDYTARRSDYDDRRSDFDDRRSDYDDRRSDYTARRSDYDDRRSDYDDRRSDYDDRRGRNNDRNERYDDRRYDDDRRRDDPRDRRYDDDPRDRRYDDDRRRDDPRDRRYDDNRPPVPSTKPPRRDYDD